jgi:ATP-dependent Zn protease
MIDSVDRDTDLILDQKNQLLTKTTEVDTLSNDIKNLKDENKELTILASSREDSLNSTKHSTENKNIVTYVYIGINILLVCLIIGFIFNLVYSSYSQSNTTMNNISRTNITNTRTNTRINNTKI